jgi:uncharacterized membrane protein YgcG
MNLHRLVAPLLCLLMSAPVLADEYIEHFHSDIAVQRNGDLEVTETILVRAEGKAIRRVIYRDFPTRYQDGRGRKLTVGFELLSVKRDGLAEAFHTENLSNGIRIYIGDSKVYLEPGFYKYRIRYRSSRQIGFFDNQDELYWNVTGSGWSFEIRKATARLTLPDTAHNLTLSGYTGPQGSTEQALDFRRIGASQAYFETTRPLARNEGMTIVAGWPKGLVLEPSAAQQRAWFIEDNKPSIIFIVGTLALLIYYLLLWRWLGRDPPAGIIVPRYRAPEGYSPASVRFIERMGYDKTCFTTAIINLAVKGAVDIDDDDGDFELVKTGPARSSLAAGEGEVLGELFADGSDSIDIERGNHNTLSKAIDRHKKSLKRDYEKKYFTTNSWLVVPALLVSAAIIVAAIASLPTPEVIFKTVFLGAFTLAPLMMIYTAVKRFVRMGKNGILRFVIFLLPLLIFAWFFFSSGFAHTEFARDVPMAMVAALIAMLALHYFFYQWLKAPTLAGRRLLDQVEGFRHYLEVAEEDELALQAAPRFNSDIYETWLPYAIALDLENEWTAKLNRAITAGTVERSYSHPRWYRSHGHSSGNFSSTLANSFNSAIAASSVAPGSSSGSSGGSSGGGGGGW